eukprot:CAMPEP_0169480934 /NCGR_PEP_ID=MMETSP1042-20121227/29837_1 /TAXON_ID=464988 /ORGANISM="Hemiselmis andersenii, Strain CCMP1180" /LENGTH=72 /DNA_ID=CAMNT_0009595629 /DNA_START=288 /DNA_END=503 /DNA_ORIENTATION=-
MSVTAPQMAHSTEGEPGGYISVIEQPEHLPCAVTASQPAHSTTFDPAGNSRSTPHPEQCPWHSMTPPSPPLC